VETAAKIFSAPISIFLVFFIALVSYAFKVFAIGGGTNVAGGTCVGCGNKTSPKKKSYNH